MKIKTRSHSVKNTDWRNNSALQNPLFEIITEILYLNLMDDATFKNALRHIV